LAERRRHTKDAVQLLPAAIGAARSAIRGGTTCTRHAPGFRAGDRAWRRQCVTVSAAVSVFPDELYQTPPRNWATDDGGNTEVFFKGVRERRPASGILKK